MKFPIDKGYRPDLISYQAVPGALADCKNLLPYDFKYAPMPQAVNYSTNTVSSPRAGMEFKDNTGVYRQFIGTVDSLYSLNSSKAFVNVTRASGGPYDAGENAWHFEQYGEWVIATNYSDAPQVLKGMTAANFQALGGTPPNAKYVLLVEGHLIFAHLNESGTPYPKKLIWSAKESVEDFAASLTTGSDSQDLADADSEITGLARSGAAFIIGHENCISVGRYIGAPFTFRFEQAKFKNIGCRPGSMVSNGAEVFFFDDHDIYKTDGDSLISIGDGIRERICEHTSRASSYRITTGVDPFKNIVYWLIATTESDGTPNRMYCYNFKTDRWTYVDIDKECIFRVHTGGIDPDSMTQTIDELAGFFIDSAMWLANAPALACMGTDGYLQTFIGAPMTGTLETHDYGDGNSINMLRRVRPRINFNTGTITGRAGYRMQEDESVNYTSEVSLSAYGYLDFLANGRYLRVVINSTSHDGIPLEMDADIVQTGVI